MINLQSVHTTFGAFDKTRLTRLNDVLKEAKRLNIDATRFEGMDLDVRFGTYLSEYVTSELSKKGVT